MLRERLLKLGARVMVSVRRWVIHLPTSFPYLHCLPSYRLPFGRAERINLSTFYNPKIDWVALLAKVCHHLSKLTFEPD